MSLLNRWQPVATCSHERRLGGYLPHVLPGMIAIGVILIGQETVTMEDLHGHVLDWAFPLLTLCSHRPPVRSLSLQKMSQTLYQRDAIAGEDNTTCGDGTSSEDLPLRIASIFVILVGASFGSLFPVLSRRTKYLRSRIPKGVFDTAKYFGSGVIVSHSQLLITFLSHTDRRSPLRLSIS